MRDNLGVRLLRAIWEVFMRFSLVLSSVLSQIKYISKFIQETLTFLVDIHSYGGTFSSGNLFVFGFLRLPPPSAKELVGLGESVFSTRFERFSYGTR